jgi:superfamily II DNA or RNA helicase
MLSKEPSRSYNTPALERWFDYVQSDWESVFSGKELEAGRKLYLEGSITGIELTDKDATINYALTRKEIYYSIIDFSGVDFKIRSSTEDEDLGRAIGIAGFYEIEELVADEISPISKNTKTSGNNQNPGKHTQRKVVRQNEKHKSTTVCRRMALEFCGSKKGLVLKPWWQELNNDKVAVFSKEELEMKPEEREQMVQLTVLTREVGFQFRPNKKDFILNDFEKISGFFSRGRTRWEALFGAFLLDNEAQKMAQGIQTVEIMGRAESVGRNKMQLDYRFKLGAEWMDGDEALSLAQSGKGTHYLEGIGLVSIKESQSKAISNWNIGGLEGEPTQWPRYMLYSLWLDKGMKLEVAGELKRWSERLIRDKTSEGHGLPNFLRPYQVEGVLWMQRLHHNGGHGLLADEMGLGKTLQVLTLIAKYAKNQRSSLIVCPASVVPVWKQEVERWYPDLEVKIVKSDELPKREKGVLWLSSYSQIRLNIDKIKSEKFEYVVLDEAQCIKNPLAKISQACSLINGEFRLAITGTPLENKLLDLWSIFNFLMPGLMGSMNQFEAVLQSERDKDVSEFVQHLKKQINPFILRRLKELVAKELPEKTEVDLICPIKSEQRELYNQYLNKGSSEMNNEAKEPTEAVGAKQDKQVAVDSSELGTIMKNKAFNLFALLTRLRQICCDPGIIPDVEFDIEESGKIMVLLSRLSEAFDGKKKRKVVIFSQFVKLIDRLNPLLKKHFPNLNIYELTGSTRDRSRPVREFQEDTNPAIILVSLKAGGTGVTLNTADYLFLMDPWWNPAVENQAIDRVHRIGQKSPVFIYRMITKGTIEERIQSLKSEKKALFDSALKDVRIIEDIQQYFGDLKSLAALTEDTQTKLK